MCQFWGITNQIGRFEGLGIPFAINPSAYADYCSSCTTTFITYDFKDYNLHNGCNFDNCLSPLSEPYISLHSP